MKMIKLLALLFLVLNFTLSMAQETWLGNIEINSNTRGRIDHYQYDGGVIDYNIASYTKLKIQFQFYKQNVTESGIDVWKNVNAKAYLYNVNSGTVIKELYIPVIGQVGNNALYAIELNSKILPDTFSKIPFELENRKTLSTELKIFMDGHFSFSIPLNLTYLP